MARVLRGSSPTLTTTFRDGEDPVDVGAVTVTVTDDRDQEVATGAATGDGAGTYTFALPTAATATVADLTVTWAGTQTRTSYVEVVGSRIAEVHEVRALKDLANDVRFPTATVEDAMAAAEDRFQEATGVAWMPRYATCTYTSDGAIILDHLYPTRILWATEDGVAADTSSWTFDASGVVIGPTCGAVVAVGYEHGRRLVPADLRDAYFTYVRALLLEDVQDVGFRATSVATEFGTFSINQAGRNAPTGIPAVDAVLADRDERLGGVA